MPKIDLYELHKTEYVAARKPALVRIGKGQYLAIDGEGAPVRASERSTAWRSR